MELFDWAEARKTLELPEPQIEADRMPDIANVEEKRRVMLERLSRGPLSTYEAERIVHRGQAFITTLRNEGYHIPLCRIDGIAYYTLEQFTNGKCKVSKTIQQKYYDTEHWKRMAQARKELDGFLCRQCGSGEKLQTHHWVYHLFAENLLRDLLTLCEDCHKALHDNIKGSACHFPRYLDAAVIARIEAGG